MKNSFLLLSRLRSVLLALTLVIGCSFAYAQTKTISGTVTNAGLPLPGVNVKIKGGSTGAVTDFDGIYKIDANEGDVLEFSSLGFENQKATVGSESTIDIVLSESVDALDEVVVVAYGTRNKQDVVGSVVSLKAEDIEKVQSVSFEQALVAKAPGVRVVQSEGGPGAGLKIQVRGNTSILASSDPLYVIDGFPLDAGGGVGNNQGQGVSGDLSNATSSPLANIDPSSIKSIEILKDASATALYGARGANGVVLITTKGGKGQKSKIEFESSIGVGRISRQIDLLNPREFLDYYSEFNPFDTSVNIGNTPEQRLFRDRNGNILPIGGEDGVRIVDWRDELFKDAILQKHRIGVSGSAGKSWYSGSLSYTDQEGVIETSRFQRYATNFNLNSQVNDKLSVALTFNGGLNKRAGLITATAGGTNRGDQSGAVTNITRAPQVLANIETLLRNLGDNQDILDSVIIDEAGFIQEINNRVSQNPQRFVEEHIRPSNEVTAYLNMAVNYKFTDNLSFRTTVGGSYRNNQGSSLYPFDFGWGRSANGRAFEGNTSNLSFLNENTLNYKINIGNHNIDALAGLTLQRTKFRQSSFQVVDFGDEDVLSNFALGVTPNGGDTVRAAENGQVGTIGRISYNFDRRYYLDVSARVDATSRFRPGSRAGFFPSLGFKWAASKESFMENVNFISDLNFKASIGRLGNQRVPNLVTRRLIQVERAETGFTNLPFQPSNEDLTWETTEQIDLGVNFGILNNRLRFQADWYQKTTKDLLYPIEVPSSAGARVQIFPGRNGLVDAVTTNLGNIRNKGLELSLGADVIDAGDFKWTVDANITFNENEVLNLGPNDEFIINSPGDNRLTGDFLFKEGEALGTFFGYETDGLYRYEDFEEFDQFRRADGTYDEIGAAELYRSGGLITANPDTYRPDSDRNEYTLKPGIVRVNEGGDRNARPGQRKYKDQNGDGLINDDDRTKLGNAQADHFGGFTNSFSYKGFDLSFIMNWSYGNEIYNKNLFDGQFTLTGTNQLYGLVRDRWTPFNRNTNQPSLRGAFPLFEQSGPADSSLIEDGSYLRLANISLSYGLPKSVVEKLSLSNLKIFTAVDNVYIWTNYSGYDPDVSIGNSGANPGVDFDAFPRARYFRLGIKGTF